MIIVGLIISLVIFVFLTVFEVPWYLNLILSLLWPVIVLVATVLLIMAIIEEIDDRTQ